MTMTQFVEYLGLARSFAEAPIDGVLEQGEPVIVLTIRPDPIQNFRPHNLALTQSQAIRLLEDLHGVLAPVLTNEQVSEWLYALQGVAAARHLDFFTEEASEDTSQS